MFSTNSSSESGKPFPSDNCLKLFSLGVKDRSPEGEVLQGAGTKLDGRRTVDEFS